MSHPVAKLFIGAAELMLVILALGILFTSFSGIKGLESQKQRQEINMQAENAQSDLVQYAGATVSGTEAAMLVKMAGYYNVCVTVNNGKNKKSYFYTDATLSQKQGDYEEILESGCLTKKVAGYENCYISPIDTYACELTTDANTGAITGITCTKKN